MKKTLAITIVGIKQMLADPVHMMFLFGLPILMTWVMSYLPMEVYEMAILGVLVMFVALNIMTSAGGYILEEKQNGTWQRILTTTTSSWQIIGGYFIRLFLMALIQAMVLLFSGKFFFGAPWDHGYGRTVIVLIVYIFAMTGLGLFLAGFLKSQGQVQAVAMAVVMIGTMLGGVFFTIENPNFLIRFISRTSPQSWAANALKDILTTGAGLEALASPLLWMGGIGLILLIGGVLKLHFSGNGAG